MAWRTGQGVLIRVGLFLAGLWVLTTPVNPGPNAAYYRGQVYGRAVVGFLLIVSAIPFRLPRRGLAEGEEPEEL